MEKLSCPRCGNPMMDLHTKKEFWYYCRKCTFKTPTQPTFAKSYKEAKRKCKK